MAWDCATGNGQAALGLAEHFASVVATDISSEQIAQVYSLETGLLSRPDPNFESEIRREGSAN